MSPSSGKLVPLFIASIGNPSPVYANTLHSAGHTVIERIRELRGFAPFRKDRKGLVSRQSESGSNFSWLPGILAGKSAKTDNPVGEENWTLWQSTSLMNVSGQGLNQAWRKWKNECKDGELVVLHDELEKPIGRVTVRWGGSPRGHNGIKSINSQLGNTQYARIGIGIGRPVSREPDDVAKYVLRKMTGKEQYLIEDTAGEIINMLRDIQEGKR